MGLVVVVVDGSLVALQLRSTLSSWFRNSAAQARRPGGLKKCICAQSLSTSREILKICYSRLLWAVGGGGYAFSKDLLLLSLDAGEVRGRVKFVLCFHARFELLLISSRQMRFKDGETVYL